MTDKLTAAGIEMPLELQQLYEEIPLLTGREHPDLRLEWASRAIDALVDMLVETTNELRLSNRMYAELTDRHTEALMRAEKAEARIAWLEQGWTKEEDDDD